MRPFRPVQVGRVAIIAPSSPFVVERYRSGLEVIRRLGYTPSEDPRVFEERGYLAGDDETRLSALNDALSDPETDVIWAARGGYGLHRIIDRIDPALLRRAEKPIVGFSDICALHAVAQSRAGIASVHGPVITQLGDLPDEDLRVLGLVLSGGYAGLEYRAAGPVITEGRAVGPILGGCLSVIAAMAGSGLLPDFDGAILLLEDVGEATYRIDRLLTQLRLSGVLDCLAGIALGDFVGCTPRNEREPSVDRVLEDRLGELGIPVLAGFPFGHGKRNQALPLGLRATLDTNAAKLVIDG